MNFQGAQAYLLEHSSYPYSRDFWGDVPFVTVIMAVDTGLVTRLKRGVYVTKGADPDVVAAFRANGLLTCVSPLPTCCRSG